MVKSEQLFHWFLGKGGFKKQNCNKKKTITSLFVISTASNERAEKNLTCTRPNVYFFIQVLGKITRVIFQDSGEV